MDPTSTSEIGAATDHQAVLLHGGLPTAHTWDYVAIALRADLRLAALDMRGHGASDWASDYSTRKLRDGPDDRYRRIDELHAPGRKARRGERAACEPAPRHPDRTESLTMVDVTSRPVFAATARMRGFMTDFRGVATVDEVVDMALAVSPKSDRERLHYRMRTLLRRADDGRLVWKSDRRRLSDDYYAMILKHLAGFECACPDTMTAPFLPARGSESQIVSEDAAHSFTARFPDGRWINIKGARHNVQEDNPRDLADALRAFWAGRLRSMTQKGVQ